jgi:glycosyltransferase 2 family protein
LIDTLAILTIMGITLFFFPFPDWIRNGMIYIGGGIVLLIVFLVGLLINTDWTIGLVGKLLRPFPHKWTQPFLELIRSFTNGLEILRSSHHYGAILGHTVILEACYILSVFLTLLGFDLIAPQYPAIYSNPLLTSAVLLVIITIGIGLPSAPGAVGTFHGIVAFGVGLFAVSAEKAMGFAIVLHLANYVPLTLLGLVCFWSQHLKFSDVKSQLPQDAIES